MEKNFEIFQRDVFRKKKSIEEALKREIYEETGLQNILNIRPFIITLSNRRIPLEKEDVGLILATYLCDISGAVSICLTEEHVDFGWFELRKASELLRIGYPAELTEKLANLRR